MPQHFTRSFHPKSKTTHTRTHKHTLFSPLPPCALAQAYICMCTWMSDVFLHTSWHNVKFSSRSLHGDCYFCMTAIHSFDAFCFFYFSFLFSLLFFTIIFSLMGFLDCCVHTRYAWCTHRYSLVILRIYNLTEQSENEKRKWGYMLLQLNAENARNELFIK